MSISFIPPLPAYAPNLLQGGNAIDYCPGKINYILSSPATGVVTDIIVPANKVWLLRHLSVLQTSEAWASEVSIKTPANVPYYYLHYQKLNGLNTKCIFDYEYSRYLIIQSLHKISMNSSYSAGVVYYSFEYVECDVIE